MNATDKRVAEKFDAFEKEQDPALIYEALEAVEAADLYILTWDAPARKQASEHWLRFLAALDRYIDPHWDPEKKPVQGISSPPAKDIAYATGEVDPETIEDPEERVQYVQALKASKEYARWYEVQFQLRRIEESAMLFLGHLLANKFPAPPAGRQELDELLAASPATDARKERVRALLPE
jgi:hypothetical protein